MTLYFLRHGIAADREAWEGDDASRPLTDEGCKAMEHEAKALARLELNPDLIITSPLKRAKQTAKILAERLSAEKRLVEDGRLAESFDTRALAAILSEWRDAKSIVLVGHEPDFSETISRVIGGGRIDLKKGGIARVAVTDPSAPSGELVWLIAPKVLGV